ncbi:MAG: class I SAM-dependent methyltransferase [Vicinamibacterales bacterium]
MSNRWKDVWAARTLDTTRASMLERLMAADGLDTGFGSVSEAAWRAFVTRTAETLGLGKGSRVFEVGCGAGAFLYPLYQAGCVVGGLDQSPALIGYATAAMPEGKWTLGDASALDPAEGWDVVLACGVFMYFPDPGYARGVIARMAAKATRAVAILDVPDVATRESAMAFRRGTMGDAEYEAKYSGLDHLFYDRSWMQRILVEVGGADVRIEDQQISGYQNARFRFNAFATLP